MTKQTQDKARAGGVAGGIVAALTVLLTEVAGLDAIHAGEIAVVAGIFIGWAMTYFSPRNVNKEE